MGRQFGFNYNEHKNDRIGVLRKYNFNLKKMYVEIRKGNVNEEQVEKSKKECRSRCRHANCCVPPTKFLKEEFEESK